MPSFAAAAAPALSTETGGLAWEADVGGVGIRLGQIAPDQVRAFYLARGFDRQAVERIARTCVFQTVLRNHTSVPISFDLTKWRASDAGRAVAPRLDADWQPEWQALGVSAPARTAFRWALFPSEQEYEPGDWNMGMVMYPLSPGTLFDLEVVWQTPGGRKTTTIRELRCAADVQTAE